MHDGNKERPPRIIERLSREHARTRAEATTNDYLEATKADQDHIVTAGGSGTLQNLDEQCMRSIYSNWCDIIEERQMKVAEAHFFAAKIFDSHESATSLCDAEMNALREALHGQFEEEFRFDSEKRQLAARVKNQEEKFDSAICLADFVSVMWGPLCKTGNYNDDGTQRGQQRPRLGSQASNIVKLLKNSKRVQPTMGSDLADYLTDLFSSIDNTQQEKISWGQFVTYMIERVYMHSLKNTTAKQLRLDSRSVTSAANGSLIYKDSFHATFPLHRQHWVQKVAYFPQGNWDGVVALDGRHAIVSLIEDFEHQDVFDGDKYAQQFEEPGDDYSYRREQLQERLRLSAAAHINKGVYYFAHHGVVNACEWISKEKLFLTVATEHKQLRFWNVHNRNEFRFINHLKIDVPDDSAVTCVRVDEKKLLSADTIKIAFGTRSGYVLTSDIVDADHVKRCHKFPTHCMKVHSDAVTDMLVLPRSQRMVSCGLDGRIIGFSPGQQFQFMTEYSGHKRGVLSMSYCSGYEVFVSGGFECSALCWAENLPRSPAFKLEDVVQPHQHPICSVMAVPLTPTVYTVDTSGVIKVFDVRTLKALGSWGAFDVGRVPTHVAHEILMGEPSADSDLKSERLIASACYTGSKHRSIFVASRSLHQFLTESRNGDADRPLNVSDPIVSFHVGDTTFLTAAATVVRVWSQFSGRILATHKTVRYSLSNVTCAAIDDCAAKIVTGHQDGLINAFHRDTGVLLRRYRFHDSRVNFVVLDTLHGLLISSCAFGQLAFWRDRDCASSHKGRYKHCISHSHRPLEPEFERRWGPLPSDLHAVVNATAKPAAKEFALSRWTVNRWTTFISEQQLKRMGSNVPEDGAKPIRTPNAFVKLLFASKSCSLMAQDARVAVLSSKTMCRVFDYTTMPPAVSHRLFLGKDRPLLDVALLSGQNLAVVADCHGMAFVWLLPPNQPAVLISSFANKCLVASYSHPHEEFRDADEDEELEVNVQATRDKPPAEDLIIETTMAPYTAPSSAIPAITCVWLDPVRFSIFSGDDVGFVSIWEIEPTFRGSCEVFDALQESACSGQAPRWVHAWRAHPLPVVHVQTTEHTSYAVITLGADNMVSIWTIGGDWLAGLRQGPVVDRTWMFPYPLLNKSALVRYRFEKLHQAFLLGELARLRRVRDGEELDSPEVHPDVRAALFGYVKEQNRDAVAHIRLLDPGAAVTRRAGFIKKKRLSVVLGNTTLATKTHKRIDWPPKEHLEVPSSHAAETCMPPSECEESASDDVDVDAQFGSVVEEIGMMEKNLLSLRKRKGRMARQQPSVAQWSSNDAKAPTDIPEADRAPIGIVEQTFQQVNEIVAAQRQHMTVREMKQLEKGRSVVVSDVRSSFLSKTEETRELPSCSQKAARQLRQARDICVVRQELARAFTPSLRTRPSTPTVSGTISLGGTSKLTVTKRLSLAPLDMSATSGCIQATRAQTPSAHVTQCVWSSPIAEQPSSLQRAQTAIKAPQLGAVSPLIQRLTRERFIMSANTRKR